MTELPDDDQVNDSAVEQIVRRELEGEDVAQGLTVTEWVLVGAAQGWDAEGESVSQVIVVNSDSPGHRLHGLIVEADTRYRARLLTDYMGDD